MNTHASHTEEYDAPCGTCRGEAKYHVTDDAPMTVSCGTCDPTRTAGQLPLAAGRRHPEETRVILVAIALGLIALQICVLVAAIRGCRRDEAEIEWCKDEILLGQWIEEYRA